MVFLWLCKFEDGKQVLTTYRIVIRDIEDNIVLEQSNIAFDYALNLACEYFEEAE